MAEMQLPPRCVNCGVLIWTPNGTGRGRCAACYRYWRREGEDHLARRCGVVLTAWQAGALREEQAARLLGCDALVLREWISEVIDQASAIWAALQAAEGTEYGVNDERKAGASTAGGDC